MHVGVSQLCGESQERWQRELGDQAQAGQMTLVKKAGAMAKVQCSHRLTTPAHGHVQDALATERDDQRVIEEILLDVVTRVADIGDAVTDHTLHPDRVSDRLASANRIGLGLVGVAALRLLQFWVMRQDGEQDVTGITRECGIDRAERGARLVGIGVRGEYCVDHGVAASAFA